MRLATYDRAGVRRLGAWVGDALVDLPDAVRHPAFPSTLEGLVTRSRGSVMEAARTALADPGHVEEAVVAAPRLLAPLVLTEVEGDGVLGPDGVVKWPDGTPCEWRPELACVLGKGGRDVSVDEAPGLMFGFLLVSTWTAPTGAVPPVEAFGPCLVTAEEFDPSEISVTTRVNRGVWVRERIGGATHRFAATIAAASTERDLLPGEVFSSAPFETAKPGAELRVLTRDATVEIEAGPMGVLRNRVRFRRTAGGAQSTRPIPRAHDVE